MEDSNRGANPSIHEVSNPARRVVLLGGIGALTVGTWKHLVLAGDPANERPEARGNIRGDVFACPGRADIGRARCAADPDRPGKAMRRTS